MVTGRIVTYDSAGQTYVLPAEHAAWLTRAAGANNLAFQARYIPLLAQVEDQIIECFRKGGGVPYSAYPRFQSLMAEDSGAVHDASLVDTILPVVPNVVGRLQAGIDVADVGCGRGHALNLMAQVFPKSRFVGYDMSAEGVAAGHAEAEQKELTNVKFELRDVTGLGVHQQYDFVTAFDAIHDQGQPAQVLRGIAEALRPDGTFLMVDISASSNVGENLDHPLGPFLYTISCMHCMTVSLAQGGVGLGAMWGEQKAREMLANAGFQRVDMKRIEGDPINNYYIAAKQ
jgi:2-polyprenyl-3-methyl-5-hydroxy-6-metoxy-1,4-benzoquinol methylase